MRIRAILYIYIAYMPKIGKGGIMKKIIAIIIVIALVAVICLTVVSCSGTQTLKTYANQSDLADNASFYTADGKSKSKPSFSDSKGDYLVIDLGAVKEFNTLTLTESGDKILKFSVWVSAADDKGKPEYKFVYESDKIGTLRACHLGTQNARFIRIVIAEDKGSFKIKDVNVYNVAKSAAKEFRVNTYLTLDAIVIDESTGEFEPGGLQACTDIILFGSVQLNADGSVKVLRDDYAIKVNALKAALAKIEAEQSRKINVVVDILMPAEAPGAAHRPNALKAMSDNLDTSVKNVKDFIQLYNFDGIDIDYEYPSNGKEWKAYNDYLRALDKAVPNMIISIATQAWATKFDKDVLDIIDRYEVMAYDMNESDGYHSTFQKTFEQAQGFIDKGIPMSKIDLGLPFYSRPTNMHEYWGNYGDAVDQLGQFTNLLDNNISDHQGMPLSSPNYYNSYGMIQDKTIYAYDMGIGGLMVFRYACDADYSHKYSLFRAIDEAIKFRQV